MFDEVICYWSVGKFWNIQILQVYIIQIYKKFMFLFYARDQALI